MGKAPKFFFGALFSLTRTKSTAKLWIKNLETFPVSFSGSFHSRFEMLPDGIDCRMKSTGILFR